MTMLIDLGTRQLSGFKKFILRGNVVDLAVGVVIGAAFTGIINSLVSGFINPLVALVGGSQRLDQLGVCLRDPCPKVDGKLTGPYLQYGAVLSALLNFVIIAFVVYFFVVKPVQKLMDRFKTEPEVNDETKQCPECLSSIPVAAMRCAFCTVEQLDALPPDDERVDA
jgi:large conductance mechanosensitive channel